MTPVSYITIAKIKGRLHIAPFPTHVSSVKINLGILSSSGTLKNLNIINIPQTHISLNGRLVQNVAF